MQTIAIHLFQIVACSGIMYGYYHFFLRNKKFHQYNRYCLLMAVVISLAVPFLKIPVYFSSNAESAVTKTLLQYNYYLMPEVVVSSASKSSVFQWEYLLIALYIFTALFLIFKIGVAITRLIKLRVQNPSEKWNAVLLIQTNENNAPFTFFNWIFWNRSIDSISDEGQKIMKHEMYHAAQKHSFDILFIEIVTAVLWFNPFYHFIKKELKAIHEFLADKHAAGDNEKLEYAEILVLQAIGTCKQTLVNPFFNNQLKRRINMLTTNTKSGSQYLRKLLALPVLVLISVLFIISCKSKDKDADTQTTSKDSVKTTEVTIADSNGNKPAQISSNPDSIKVTEVTIAGTSNNPESKPPKVEFRDKNGKLIPDPEPEIYTKVQIDAAFPGGAPAWKKFLETNLRGETPVDHGAAPGNYTAIIQFIVDKEGNVSDVKPLTKHGFGMEEEAVRVIKKSGKWKPAMTNGKEVKAYRKQPVTFQIVEQ